MSLAVGPSETRETNEPEERREAALLPQGDQPNLPNQARMWRATGGPLHLPVDDCRLLLERLGPSLALWRAAEVAALREHVCAPPVLDLGCGDGLVGALALRGRPIAIGIDPDRRQIARTLHVDAYERLLPQRMEALPSTAVRRESVSTVISNSVLEHLPSPEETLRTINRALVHGGRLIFTTPSEVFGEWLAVPAARYGAWRNRQLTHRNLWEIDRWAEALDRAGLRLETTRPYLRRRLVALWDALELAQMVWVGRRRLASLAWRRLSPATLDALAHRLARTDLGADKVGGGRLYVARKVAAI